jgi:succinoglycan biosynthesis transport protein ExoP
MTFEQFYRILRARRKLAWSVYLTILVLTVAYCLLWPKNYTATTNIVVESKIDPITGFASAGASLQTSALLATQMSIIKSDHVARQVVRDLKLDQSAETHETWQKDTSGLGSFEDWLAKRLLKGLTVEPSKESTVVELSYESIEPNFAATLANAFAKAYLDTLVQMKTEPARQYAGYFEERAALARTKLEAAQKALSTAQKERGIFLTDERMDAESARLNEMGLQLTSIRSQRVESSSRRQVVDGSPERIADVSTNAVVMQFKADLSRTQGQLSELQSTLGDNHPSVKQLKANIEQQTRRLNAEIGKAANVVRSVDVVLREREDAASKVYEAQRQRLMTMKDQRNEVALLEREVDSAAKVYESMVLRQSQSSLESNNNQSNAYILSAAVAPPNQSSPKTFLAVALAITMGTVVTLFLTMAAELLDRRVRTADDLINALDLPVLGALPSPDPSRLALFGKKLGFAKLSPANHKPRGASLQP